MSSRTMWSCSLGTMPRRLSRSFASADYARRLCCQCRTCISTKARIELSTRVTERQKVWAVVQARMSSRRFPGKVLASVMGRPMLGFLLDRISHCDDLDGVCVATSVDASDDSIAAFCSKEGIECYRG